MCGVYNAGPMAAVKFEQALARLETIVRSLEQGDLSLEESMKRFEEGVKLSKNCMKMLEEAERKVEILMTDKEGNTRTKPFVAEQGTRLNDGGDDGEAEA